MNSRNVLRTIAKLLFIFTSIIRFIRTKSLERCRFDSVAPARSGDEEQNQHPGREPSRQVNDEPCRPISRTIHSRGLPNDRRIGPACTLRADLMRCCPGGIGHGPTASMHQPGKQRTQRGNHAAHAHRHKHAGVAATTGEEEEGIDERTNLPRAERAAAPDQTCFRLPGWCLSPS